MSIPRTPPKVPRPGGSAWIESPAEQRWAASDAAGRDSLTASLRTLERTPLIEADSDGCCVVTFVCDAPGASAVLLFVNRVSDERAIDDSAMRQLGDSGLWVRAVRMRADWRASYQFLVHEGGHPPPWSRLGEQRGLRQLLDRGRADPGNPALLSNRAGHPVSVVSLPDAPSDAGFASAQADAAPLLTEHLVDSPQPGSGRRVWMYRPPVPSTALAVLLDGEVWAHRFGLVSAVDGAIRAGEMPPIALAMVDSVDVATRWRELGGTPAPASDEPLAEAAAVGHRFRVWLAGPFLAAVGEQLSVAGSSVARVAVAGQSLGGYAALRAASEHPTAISAAISQSGSLWLGEIPARSDGAVPAIRLSVGLQEWALRPHHLALVERMRARRRVAPAGAFEYVEFNGGHDYACWRVDLLEALGSVARSGLATPRVRTR